MTVDEFLEHMHALRLQAGDIELLTHENTTPARARLLILLLVQTSAHRLYEDAQRLLILMDDESVAALVDRLTTIR